MINTPMSFLALKRWNTSLKQSGHRHNRLLTKFVSLNVWLFKLIEKAVSKSTLHPFARSIHPWTTRVKMWGHLLIRHDSTMAITSVLTSLKTHSMNLVRLSSVIKFKASLAILKASLVSFPDWIEILTIVSGNHSIALWWFQFLWIIQNIKSRQDNTRQLRIRS